MFGVDRGSRVAPRQAGVVGNHLRLGRTKTHAVQAIKRRPLYRYTLKRRALRHNAIRADQKVSSLRRRLLLWSTGCIDARAQPTVKSTRRSGKRERLMAQRDRVAGGACAPPPARWPAHPPGGRRSRSAPPAPGHACGCSLRDLVIVLRAPLWCDSSRAAVQVPRSPGGLRLMTVWVDAEAIVVVRQFTRRVIAHPF